MAQQFRIQPALLEDPASIACTFCNSNSGVGESNPVLLPPAPGTQGVHRYTSKQNTYTRTRTNKIVFKGNTLGSLDVLRALRLEARVFPHSSCLHPRKKKKLKGGRVEGAEEADSPAPPLHQLLRCEFSSHNTGGCSAPQEQRELSNSHTCL